MRALAQRLWHFVREVSGEAALERRMAGCPAHGPAQADGLEPKKPTPSRERVDAALRDTFEGVCRCC